MKHVKSNGLTTEVRDIGPVVYLIKGPGVPAGVNKIMSDQDAKTFLEELRMKGWRGQAFKHD